MKQRNIKANVFILLLSLAAAANAAKVKVADCERDPQLDFWAAADNEFCVKLMESVFQNAGLEIERLPFGEVHLMDATNADVVCSAFRTKKMLENFEFPQQPLSQVHIHLYCCL